MVSFFRTHFSHHPRRVTAMVLAFAFCIGLFLGAYTAKAADISIHPLMRTAAEARVSIVNLLPALLLPFLFSAFAVYISQIWLLIPIAFLKAFFFSYVGACFMISNPGSGWLLRALFMFTDCLSVPVLCWYWLYACRSRVFYVRIAAASFLTICGICCLDFQFISPFLASLLS